MTAPHPLATLRFRDCRVPVRNRLGEPGAGFKVAMETLDVFRASVAAAALGLARRALDEALARARGRKMFGQVLADFQLTQAAIADMATAIDSSALLTYRAAWLRDVKGVRTTREAAMAKLVATESAQQVIDRAVQIFGGLGVQSGHIVEQLVSRHPAAAHLRGRERGAEADHRAGNAEGLADAGQRIDERCSGASGNPESTQHKFLVFRSGSKSIGLMPGCGAILGPRRTSIAHERKVATVHRARRHLCTGQSAPRNQWPELIFDIPDVRYGARLNCVVELLDNAVAAGYGERAAIRSPAGVLSYGALLALVNRIAHVLREELGLVPGNRVLLRGPNNPMMAACWLAVVKAGCIAVATMPLLRAKELKPVIDKAQCNAALCDVNLRDEMELVRAQCPALGPTLYFNTDTPDSLDTLAAAKPAEFPAAPTAADDVCIIAFTSGTTGVPKGTMHFHRDVMAICDCFPRSCLHPHPEDHLLRHTTARVYLRARRPAAVSHALRRLDLADREAHTDRSACRHRAVSAYGLFHGPDVLPADGDGGLRLRHFQPDAVRIRGRSAPSAHSPAVGKGNRGSSSSMASAQPKCCTSSSRRRERTSGRARPARPSQDIERACSTTRAIRCRRAKSGRLAVKGPTGCRYLADERQKSYVYNGWNLTGDAYLMDEDGYFWYQARTDDMIISAGYNIAGPEVESALLLHPAVAECGVVGVPDDERGQIVKAFVVLKKDYAPGPQTAQDLQEFVKQTIAPYKYPRAIEFRDALPRTETGKLQRFKLRELIAAHFPAPKTHKPSHAERTPRLDVQATKATMQILQPPGWARPRGYSNGILTRGQLVFVAGQIGWDAQCRFQTTDLSGQVRQALENVVAVLAQAGARPEHIVRMTWYVTDKHEYVAAFRFHRGRVPPGDRCPLSCDDRGSG